MKKAILVIILFLVITGFVFSNQNDINIDFYSTFTSAVTEQPVYIFDLLYSSRINVGVNIDFLINKASGPGIGASTGISVFPFEESLTPIDIDLTGYWFFDFSKVLRIKPFGGWEFTAGYLYKTDTYVKPHNNIFAGMELRMLDLILNYSFVMNTDALSRFEPAKPEHRFGIGASFNYFSDMWFNH